MLANCWFYVLKSHYWGQGIIVITYIMFNSHYWGKNFTHNMIKVSA